MTADQDRTVDTGPTDASAAICAAAERIAAAGESSPRAARDPVNLPMIRNWTEAIGDANPVYTDAGAAERSGHGGLVAPPAMAQVWTMRGLHPRREDDDPLGLMSAVLDEAGFTSVVATNCEQEYDRYLRPGEQVTVRARLESVTGPKQTSLGEGWFVTTRNTWYVGTEPVATMLFRVLKFRPKTPGLPTQHRQRPSPARTCCGRRSRRTPSSSGTARPRASCGSSAAAGAARCGTRPGRCARRAARARPGYVVAAGTGEVYSYVVHHHPPVPGKQLPIVVALVELPEGVRMVGELLGTGPEQVRIGLPVRVEFVRVDDELTLPAWREDAR